MADYKKITVVVLGDGEFLKKSLIVNITGKDICKLSKRRFLTNIEIYEADLYEFICTPDLSEGCEDIKQLFAINKYPDMCVLVVEDDFKVQDVKQQLGKLEEASEKNTNEFIVVPPLCYKNTQESAPPFTLSTMEKVLRDLGQPSKPRHPNMSNDKKSHADSSASGFWKNMISWPKGKPADRQVNLVLLGMSGTGKSATGNTILGKTHFKSMPSAVPVTTECQEAETQIDGTRVHVIDTPDIFEDDFDPSVRKYTVEKCKQLYETGPHVFLLVLQVSRFIDGERDILKKLQVYFGGRVHEKTVILFTCGADLHRDQMNLSGFLHCCQSELKKIVEMCHRRCVLFENRSSDRQQVKQLMLVVNSMLEQQY